MNIKKIKQLEARFLSRYHEGFKSDELKTIGKKHNLSKLVDYTHQVCSTENLKKGLSIFFDVTKVISKSSMVSVFEKMRFRDLVKEFDNTEKILFLEAIYNLIHLDEELGFNQLYDMLAPYKLAKWPIITCYRAYYNINYDVFVKPTTVKKILKFMEIEDIKYTPKVNYEFYAKYRDYINEMKNHVDESLRPNNPAFSGFFMMTIE